MAVDPPPLENPSARHAGFVLIVAVGAGLLWYPWVPMIPRKPTPLHAGVFVVALTAVVLLASLLARPLVEPDFFLLFLAVVLASAWLYGWGGGALATALCYFALLYFFLPESSLSTPAPRVAVRLGLFVLEALLITWLTASWRSNRGLLEAALTSTGDAVILTDRRGAVTFMNSVAEALTGWKRAEARGRPLAEVLRMVSEDTREEIAATAGNERVAGHALLVARDGPEIPIDRVAAPLRDSAAAWRGGILVFRDVSSRKQIEEQAAHSQKMDAVARLARGVAGDFNNLLTVVTGYSDLIRHELDAANPLRRFAEEILYAAERAAALTRQLLAFSTAHESQPRQVDLNSILVGMDPMLRRLLGEGIDLIVLPDPNLGLVNADPDQIEQVVVNLATNSRDAMPNGGQLVLETANVELEDAAAGNKIGAQPGSYVMLMVGDTGTGMDAATRSHMFEPFFTTKEPGKASGLGLSTAYGIIRHSGGQITVYSQPDCGTIFEIYLPRLKPAPAERRKSVPPKGSETVLLVDDEDGVRKLISAILHANGYSVLEAFSGQAALAVYEKNAHKIDLVLTDIVMPQMDGLELGTRLAERKPGLKVLYMSGYRDHPASQAVSQSQRPFLQKPFTPDGLLNKVRETLDAEIKKS